MAKRTAVIDIGSNSIRMVVFEKSSRFAFHLLHEEKSRVRVSENAYENNGFLQEVAINRTIDALENFLSIIKSYKARKIFCVATSAIRDAKNKKEFLSLVYEKLKINIKVISGEQEAYYGGIACAGLLPYKNSATIDIGGGSTEITVIQNSKVINSYSLNLGTVRLKELFFDKNDLDGAKKYIEKELSKFNIPDLKHIIGVGGTFRAITQAIQQSSEYPLDKLHGYEFNIKKLNKFSEKILKATTSEIRKLGIKKERDDVIKPGVLILNQLLLKFNTQELVCSGAGVREGIFLHDLLRNSNDMFPANFNPSVRYLLDSHDVDSKFGNNLAKTSKILFDILREKLSLDDKYKSDLIIASKLAIIGSSVHFYSFHKHSYYMIQSALEYGFTHKQIMLIATLARFQKNRSPSEAHIKTYSQLLPDVKTLNSLSLILSLSNILNSSHEDDLKLEFTFENDTLYIDSKGANLYLAKEQFKELEIVEELNIVFK